MNTAQRGRAWQEGRREAGHTTAARWASLRSSSKTIGCAGATTASAPPISRMGDPSFSLSAARLVSALMLVPLTSSFCFSTGTPVSAKTCAINTCTSDVSADSSTCIGCFASVKLHTVEFFLAPLNAHCLGETLHGSTKKPFTVAIFQLNWTKALSTPTGSIAIVVFLPYSRITLLAESMLKISRRKVLLLAAVAVVLTVACLSVDLCTHYLLTGQLALLQACRDDVFICEDGSFVGRTGELACTHMHTRINTCTYVHGLTCIRTWASRPC